MSGALIDPPVDRRLFIIGASGLAAGAALGFGATTSVAQSPFPSKMPVAWADAEELPLWPDGLPGGGYSPQERPADMPAVFLSHVERPYLKVFRPAAGNGRSLLVIPGGGYVFVSILNEGLEIADEMTAQGYTVFVLVYRLPSEGWTNRADVPLQDAQRAMRVIRHNAVRYSLDSEKVAAIGFSAGGHLAASLATGFAELVYPARDAADRLDARPFVVGLIYPVISLVPPYAHSGSAVQLLGPDPSPDLIARRSPAGHVTATTPPVFLLHALDDKAVPQENSLEMLKALGAASRPVEVHLFEEGGHGFGLGPRDHPVRQWLPLFATWISRHALDAA